MVKRVRAARHYQHPKAPIRLIALTGRRRIRAVLRPVLAHLKDLIDTKKALHFASAKQPRQIAIQAVDWHHFREVLKTPHERISQVYEAGARLATRKINGAFIARGRRTHYRKIGINVADPNPDGSDFHLMRLFDEYERQRKRITDRFDFDRFSDPVRERMREMQDDLIVELEKVARNAIETAIRNAVERDLSPDATVAAIRDVISLTANQSQAVMNYRASLENLDPSALRRQLRDSQYDSAVRASIDGMRDLDEAVIDEMVNAYAENYLTYRAETIARTESNRAANYGLQDAYQQAIDRGALPSEAIRQYWQIAVEENACPVCLSIPDMNPDGVPIGESFLSIDGPQEAPPDPHPNCQCSIEVRVDLDLVPDEQQEAA